MLAAALDTPVAVTDTASEGGAWGMALLAAYRAERSDGLTLSRYLSENIFDDDSFETLVADPSEVAGFAAYMSSYRTGLPIERQAAELLTAPPGSI